MAGRAQRDVLRIMRTLAGGDEDTATTSPRKYGRPTTPRTWHPDVLTTDDILQEKYTELGKLLASQYVERKALSVLESTLMGQKKRRARPVSAKNMKKSSKAEKQKKQRRPVSACTSAFSQSADESPWWYDSDGTDYTETSGSAKRVSFADDVVSFSGESSVVITELTEDDAEFEERIRRKPRVSLAEEEMEANEMRYCRDKRDMEQELMRSILRSPRSSSSRPRHKSPKRSTTPTTPRSKSPEHATRTTKSEKQNANLTKIQVDYDEDDDVNIKDDSTLVGSADDDEKTCVHFDDDDFSSERKTRKKSPRKDANKRSTTPRENSKSPRKGKATRTTSPSRKNSKNKRSPRKKKTITEEEDVALEPESPRKEYVPLDNQLTQSHNKHIKTWLRKKEADLRKQKREERKKDREKMKAERKVRELRAQRIEEAEGKYDEWMTNKKKVNKINKRVARKVLEDDVAEQNQDGGAEETRPKSPTRTSSPRRSRYAVRKKKEYVPPVTTHENSIGIVRDYTGDWSESVNCKRDLAAERERDEEKRQSKEAKKRERIQKAAKAKERKNDPKPKRTFPRASKSPPNMTLPRKNEKEDKSVNKPKPTRPSNNPFKGMTYDEWLNQKIKSEQTWKEEVDQELEDPDLADLIPLLAKHRIQHAKETSRRVDSGLSRTKSSAASRKAETCKAFDADDGRNPRSYTWNNSDTKKTKDSQWTSFPKRTSPSPSPRSTPLLNKRDNIGVRPEPQGCEIPSYTSHCQNGGKDNGDQDSVFMTETSIAT